MKIPTSKRSGVYRIRNVTNDKLYVGSAKVFRQRAQSHVNELRKGTHHSSHLQHAWDKYGENAFVFEIVEFCDEDRCLEREQWYLDFWQPWNQDKGYNLSKQAGNAMGGRNHSEESCQKMSEKRKGIVPVAATAAAALHNKGRKRTPEECAALSAGMKGHKKSKEHIAKLSGENHWTKRPGAETSIKKRNNSLRGKKHTEEHKAAIGASHWKNRPDAEEIAARMVAKVAATKAAKKAAAFAAL